jgi:glycosyltransferase involved in cell wall biosynthesis
MKILVIMPWIRQGGAELTAVQAAYQLQNLGHQVRLAALFVDTSQMSKQAKKITYVTFGGLLSNFFKKNKFIIYFFGPFFLLWLVLKQAKWADILFPHLLPSYWVAPVVAKFNQKKVVWFCSEPPKKRPFGETGLLDWLMWRLADSYFDKFLVQGVDQIIVCSQGLAREIKERYGQTAAVVHSGVDFSFFSQREEKLINSLKEKYALEGKQILLCAGKLHPQKNQRLLIEAMGKISPQLKEVILVLVGRGTDEKYLQEKTNNLQLKNRVIFAGFTSNQELRSWYALASLVLYPSVGQTVTMNQSWGLVPFEALCQKKITLITPSCGAEEILKKEKIGIVCPATAEAYSKMILKLLKEKNKLVRMGEKGYWYVKNHHSWKEWAKRVEKELKK